MKKWLVFLIITLSLILSGCNNETQSSEEIEDIEEILIDQMDLYVDVLNGKEKCGKLMSVASRESESIDFSNGTEFFASVFAKYAPNFVVGKFMEIDCDAYLDGFEGLTDVSYTVDKWELDDDEDKEIAKLYVKMNAYEGETLISKDKVFYFEQAKDSWLIYESKYY